MEQESSEFSKSGNLMNQANMNLSQFTDLVSYMCLAGYVVASWSLTQEMAGSSSFTIATIILSLNSLNSVKTFRENSIIKYQCYRLLILGVNSTGINQWGSSKHWWLYCCWGLVWIDLKSILGSRHKTNESLKNFTWWYVHNGPWRLSTPVESCRIGLKRPWSRSHQ